VTIRALVLISIASLVALACDRAPAAKTDAASESRDICLADPNGSSSLDEGIRGLQTKAHRLPIEPESWVRVGQGWVRKARLTADPGFYVNVDACVNAALALSPSNRSALQLRSLALMNDHRFSAARDVANAVLRDEPTDAVSLGVMSDALLELGHFDEAVATTQRMIDAQPNMASYSRAAYVRWLEGDTRTAKMFMRFALNGRDMQDREPTAWTFVQAANIYWNEGDYSGADAVLAEALKWVPDYVPALIARGRVALGAGRPKEAVDYLQQAFTTSHSVEAAWLLGDAQQMLGNASAADSAYDEAITEGRKADRLTLALFYATKNRNVDEGLRLIEEERSGRSGIYVSDAYAWSLYRAGRLDEARRASDEAMQLGTPDARLLYHAGAIRLARGDATGRELIQRALTLNPRFDCTGAAEAARLVSHAAE
jgi:tetratricopeptide (TPR) repeat protein